MLQPIDIQQKLITLRDKSTTSKDVLSWVQTIFDDLEDSKSDVLNRLSKSPIKRRVNAFNIDNVNSEHIFHISHIEKICVDYRLRFLDTKYFKGDYPHAVIEKIEALESTHNTILDGFKIIAPSKLFELNEADDPLLFAPMGNGYYYLVHKWGKDLHPLRKLKYWSVKTVENMLFAVVFASLLFTLLSKSLFYGSGATFGEFFILFLFFVKGIIGMIFFLGVASGKNFSAYCWTSRFNKIS